VQTAKPAVVDVARRNCVEEFALTYENASATQIVYARLREKQYARESGAH